MKFLEHVGGISMDWKTMDHDQKNEFLYLYNLMSVVVRTKRILLSGTLYKMDGYWIVTNGTHYTTDPGDFRIAPIYTSEITQAYTNNGRLNIWLDQL